MIDIDFQGTWQFMSANLISQMNGDKTTHTIEDDLESSIYVLMWMTLMYSETSDKGQVPSLLSGVLDPKPYGPTGGFGKADFLKARTFLERIAFPGRLHLHRLITQLAKLFAVRYETKPTDTEYATADFLLQNVSANPDDPRFLEAYHGTIVYLYETRMEALKGYEYTIDLFNTALQDPASWPTDDYAVKQDFKIDPSPPQQVIKSEWDTAVFVNHMDDLDDCDENHGIEHTVEDLSWSDISFDGSNRMDDSEVSNSPLLPEHLTRSTLCLGTRMSHWESNDFPNKA
jgi:hypothetical protein